MLARGPFNPALQCQFYKIDSMALATRMPHMYAVDGNRIIILWADSRFSLRLHIHVYISALHAFNLYG